MIAQPDPWEPVPILMYHAVEDSLRPPQYKHFYVLRDEFHAQMRILKQRGRHPILFPQLVQALRGEIALPPKPVLLTFDDGYANLLENAHPLLTELGFPYTVFLASDWVGKTNAWVKDDGYEDTPLLQWSDIEQMQESGQVDFQAHTLTHPKLNLLSGSEAAREIQQSRVQIEQRLQRPVHTFCYPYGHYNDAIMKITEDAGYQCAVTTDFGRVRRRDSLFRLPRISVYHVPQFSMSYGPRRMNFVWRLESRKDQRSV